MHKTLHKNRNKMRRDRQRWREKEREGGGRKKVEKTGKEPMKRIK